MGKRFLVDTNILLEYIGGILPEDIKKSIEDILSNDFHISVINRIETLGHPSATKEISDFLNIAIQHELTPEVVEQTIMLRKTHKIKLPDAIIAATAIVHNLVLISRNAKDFKIIKAMGFFDPYDNGQAVTPA